MADKHKFWDKIADKYARRPVSDEASYQTKLAKTREYLTPDSEVFEFGCGTGSTAITHGPYVKHIQATDLSEGMLAIARDRAAAAGVGNVTFSQAEIDDFTAPDGSFDVVLGMSILHLLADRDAMIAKVFKLLRPGGVFVSSTTCMGDFVPWIKFIAPIGQALGKIPLLKVFTMQDLVDSVSRAGFEIDHQWHPGKSKAVFIVAKKPG